MSDELKEGGAPAPAPVATAVDAAQAPAQGSDELLRNPREVIELRKEVRELTKMFKDQLASRPAVPESKAEKSPAPAVDAAVESVATLRREWALEKALTEFGAKPGPVRDLIEKAVASDKPQDVREYVQRFSSLFTAPAPTAAPAAPAAAAPAPAQAPVGRTDTGAPGVDFKASLPSDPRQIPPDVFKSLSREKQKEIVSGFISSQGVNRNPFARK